MKRKMTAAILVASLGLSACVPLVIAGGVAVGAWIGSDPRKTETIKDDTELSSKLSANVIDEWKEKAHVNVNAFNGAVLLSGEVPSDEARKKLEEFARKYPKMRRIYNETVVAQPSSAMDRMNDTQLTTRVKSAVLLSVGDAASVHIQVITERKVVYLLGIIDPALANKAAQAAASVSGVAQVVKLMEAAPK